MRQLNLIFLLLVVFTPTLSAAEERTDWSRYFDQYDAEGTIVVLDQRFDDHPTWVYSEQRASTRISPASTFKIPHTLMALDVGAVHDEFQVFTWDGEERSFSGHNRDQDIRSAMRMSAVWVYEHLADTIGEERAAGYLEKIGYGSAKTTTDEGAYWIYGDLSISAYEQILFLQQLYKNELPFSVEHQRLVKDLIVTEAQPNWILRAKTGWDGQIGWWVGWVEWPAGPVFFALNIDTPNRMEDLAKREQIVRAILRSIDALPAP